LIITSRHSDQRQSQGALKIQQDPSSYCVCFVCVCVCVWLYVCVCLLGATAATLLYAVWRAHRFSLNYVGKMRNGLVNKAFKFWPSAKSVGQSAFRLSTLNLNKLACSFEFCTRLSSWVIVEPQNRKEQIFHYIL